MKRWLGVLLGIGVLLLGWSTFRSADASEGHCGQVEERVTVLARGGAGRAFVALDDVGEIAFLDPETNETIIPLRPFFTILSDASAITWDESNRTAQFRYGTHELSLQVTAADGLVTTRLDGTPYPLRAYVCAGHLHAPLRGVTDALGLKLQWYHAERTAVVDPVWTTGVPSTVKEPAATPQPKRPSSCSSLEQVGWSDVLTNPLGAWNRTLQRTACALVI